MTFIKYYEMAKINFINSFVYTFDILSGSVFVGLIIFIFINLWKAVYGDQLLIEGFTISMMLWYLVMTESLVTSQGKIIQDIGVDVRSGNLANVLNKPYNYISYKFSTQLGSSIFKFGMTFIMASIIVYIFLGGIKVSLISIPLILLIVLLSMTLYFLISAFLGLFAFWLEDTEALHFVYQKVIFTIGGMLVPLEIFPAWLAKISIILPFSYIAYHPARLFVLFDFPTFIRVFSMLLIWILVMTISITILYKIAVRKVSVNGG
ncbi:ABC-2 family transporter protein [Candidatus Woesearchaeota archaeon]|nr:ABC-2 family transporter protein [Candidatus Woesearchaeota archaeon]